MIELPRVCGVIDAPYVARYRRDGSGLALVEVVAVEVPVGPSDVETNGEAEKCPYCGSVGMLVHCEKCGAWICSASRIARNADGRDFFLCRASCRNRSREHDGRTGA